MSIFISLSNIIYRQSPIVITIASITVLAVIHGYLGYRKAIKSLNDYPGLRLFVSPISLLGHTLLPRIPGVSLGYFWPFTKKYQIFKDYGRDIISAVSLFPSGQKGYVIADSVVANKILLKHNIFFKEEKDYTLLNYFGKNILTTSGSEWKKHRRIVAPTFSERNTKLVWHETVNILQDLFDLWGDQPQVVVNHVCTITNAIALMAISAAGFGRKLDWKEEESLPPNHKMTFKHALHITTKYLSIYMITPKWVRPFFKALRLTHQANNELRQYFEEMIMDRRGSEVKEEKHDLFSALLDGSRGGEDDLTDDELLGDVFIFMVAGHETTGHSLAYALGLLALYQNEQENLYQYIKATVPEDKQLTYECASRLSYPLAVLYETLRLFPPASSTARDNAEDTYISYQKGDGSVDNIFIPKQTRNLVHIAALHVNPHYWQDPDSFKPARFLSPDYPKDAFMPFISGPRACIGRRFAEIESIAVLTMLVGRYKIELKEPELYEGLSALERREKLLASTLGITLTPVSVPLVFTRR